MIEKGPYEKLVETVGSPYGLLLVFLLAILALYPFLGYFPFLLWALNVSTLAIVAAALRLTNRKGALYFTTVVLGLCTFSADLASHLFEIKTAYPVASGVRTAFMTVLIVAIFADIMGRKKVTIDAVLGACCVLILLALAFGSAYILVEWIAPGSFRFPDHVTAAAGSSHQTTVSFELLYFSLVTITTIGYGDIVPVAPPARSLATLEGLLSQLYLAIILARLVGLEISQRWQGPHPDDE